jgi:hypothetical protein
MEEACTYELLKLLLMGGERWQVFIGLILVSAFSQVHKRWQHSVSFVSVIPESSNGPSKRGLYKARAGRQAGETAAVGCDVQVTDRVL